jgi:hypothetical protein
MKYARLEPNCGHGAVTPASLTLSSFKNSRKDAPVNVKTISIALLLIAVGVGSPQAFGQAPANDECINASVVSDGSNPIDNTGANQSVTLPVNMLVYNPVGFEYAPASFSGVDVWYSYTAPVTGIRNFEVVNNGNSTPASILTIYSACGGPILASDIAGGVAANAKIRHFAVTAGTTYLIRYALYGAAGNTAAAALSIAAPPTTFNAFDDCEMALPFAGQGTLAISTAGMTSSDSRGWDCDYSRNDGWIAWTPSVSGIGVVNGCALNNAIRTKISAYTACGTAPLICSASTTVDPPNANCGPKLPFRVTAGQTYLIRVGNSRVTDVTSGDLVFEVRPDDVIMSIPAGAIPEPEMCSNNPADDVNNGCGNPTGAVTPIQLCNTYWGTATSRRTNQFPQGLNYWLDVDADIYEFTLTQDDTVTLVGQAEFAPRVSIRVGCGPVVDLVNSTVNNAAAKVGGIHDFGQRTSPTGPFVANLVAGTYQLYIAPKGLGFNYHDCSKDNRYWFKLTSSNPCAVTNVYCCRGTTCTSVAAGTCTGTTAGTAFTEVSSCGTGATTATCCFADYDHNGARTIDDIFVYLNAWFAASPYTKVGGDGMATPSIDDIFVFINNWFAGCN